MRFDRYAVGIRTVMDALQNENVDDLKKLAALFPSSARPTRKADLVAFVREKLEGPNLIEIWRQLDTLQKAFVAEAVHSLDSSVRESTFAAKYNALPEWETEQSKGLKSSRTVPSLLNFFFFSKRSVMPDDLKAKLKGFVPEPVKAAIATSDEPPVTFPREYREYDNATASWELATEDIPVEQRVMERTAQRDLVAVLRLVNSGKISVSETTRMPSAAAMAVVESVLDGGEFYHQPAKALQQDHPTSSDSGDDTTVRWDASEQKIGPIRSFAWPVMLQAAKLVEISAKKLRLTKSGQKALAAPPAEALSAIWSRWMSTTMFDEFNRIDAIKGQSGKGKRGMTALADRRDAVSDALRDCPVGQWIRLDEFWRYMRASGNDFKVTRDPWRLYIGDSHYGSLGYNGHHSWSILQGRYVACLLFEYAATLGMVDVVYAPPHSALSDYRDQWGTDEMEFLSRYDGLLSFRVNPLGDYCLGIAVTYTPSEFVEQPVLQVLANLDIVQTGEGPAPGDVLMLDTIAERASDAVWRLDRGRLLEAAESGHEISEIRDFLSARSAHEIPQPVARLLTDVEARANRVRYIGAAQLFECADAELAALVANDSRTSAHCMLSGSRHLAVPVEAEARFRRSLRQLGYVARTGAIAGKKP